MKKYPFSVQKHAHDIEFRINRTWNVMHDMLHDEIPWDEAEYDRLEKLHDDLCALRDAVMFGGNGYVAWLTGKEIGLAKDTVAWAAETRAGTLIKAGKRQYLQYV